MGIKKAVSNTCPIIHLSEIGCFHCLRIVNTLFIPKSVESEIRSKNAPGKNELRTADWIITKTRIETIYHFGIFPYQHHSTGASAKTRTET